jgi:hypothetical protein
MGNDWKKPAVDEDAILVGGSIFCQLTEEANVCCIESQEKVWHEAGEDQYTVSSIASVNPLRPSLTLGVMP